MGKYDRQAATAKRLIKKYGGPASVVRVEPVTGGDPWDNNTAKADKECMAVMLDYDVTQIDGTAIKRGDKLVYIAATGVSVVPTTSDQFKFNGNTWAIESVNNLSPNGQNILYTLQVRQ